MGVAPLKSDDNLVTDAAGKADVLNRQFSSVFTQEQINTMPDKGASPYPNLPKITITRNGVEALLQKVKPKKASGPDLIPARFLHEMAEPLSAVLSFIFQQSLDSGTVPDDWRTANVVPIFKKGDRGLASNYRPVSLTALACKTMEHIVVSSILDHLDAHNILSDLQHGFRAKRSCETQLTITTQDLASALNRHRQVDMAVLDFSKAFDKVPHQRLLHKLRYYGVTDSALAWIGSFLSGRSQQVVVDGAMSSQCPVLSGVPQGTVLGPLLFLLFINDIADDINSTIRLFADDCLLYREILTPEDSIMMQRDLDTLHQWSERWQMAFNTDKCFIMRVTLARKNITQHQYTMNGSVLTMTNDITYLGVVLNNKLQWDSQVNKMCAKSQRLLGFLRRNMYGCPAAVKERTYMTLVRPLVEYCSPVWSPHLKKHINKVERVQRVAARFVTRRPYRRSAPDSVTALVTSLGWDTLETRRHKASLTSLYKMVDGHVAIPETYHPAPKPHRQTRLSNTRQFFHRQADVNAYKYAFIQRTIPLWNQLSDSIVTSPSVNCFKQRLADVQLPQM